MRAIVQERYGPPLDVLKMAEVGDPRPAPGQVLVRVRAASVNALDWRLARGEPFLVRLAYGLARPKHRVRGADAAGVVAAVGDGVADLAPGDEVLADLSATGFGAFAELVAAPAGAWSRKPPGVSFEDAAALPVAGVTALQAARDVARVAPGEAVLVNGAAGGVGSFAVQVARALGGTVTAACSTRSLDRVRALGAARVLDRTRDDPAKDGARFDVVLDCAAQRSVRDWGRVLAPGGRYVLVGGSFGRTLQAMALGPALSRGGRTFGTMLAKPRREDLDALIRMVEGGAVKPLLDRRYPLEQAAEAVAHLEAGRAQGKTVVVVDEQG